MARISGSIRLSKRQTSFILNRFRIDEQQADNIDLICLEILKNQPHNLAIHSEDEKINFILAWISTQCISLSHFEWIDIKNKRMCDYLWSMFCMLTTRQLIKFKDEYFRGELTINQDGIVHENTYFPRLQEDEHYRALKLDLLPKDSNAKKELIINFIDALDFESDYKKNLIEKAKEKWILICKKNDVSNWVDDDDDDKKTWAWHYLHQENTPIWFINNDKRNDYSEGVITTFDLLCDHPDKRALTLSKMKSAWSQKAYRDRNNGKKSVSIVLPEEVIKNLDYICQKTDRRKNEVVARLIRNEYDKVHKGKD